MEQLSYDAADRPSPPPPVNRRRHLWLGLPLLVIGCGLLAFAARGLWQQYRTTHNPQPLADSSKVITQSEAAPDETPINTNSQYPVPAHHPRKIALPSIGSSGFVQRVGIDQTGAVAVPSNINLAGWFVGEAIPGQPGLSIIDGHVQGKYAPGIFKQLGKLEIGAIFTIEFGDQSIKRFEVVSAKLYDVSDAAKHLFEKQVHIASQLNLITCSGSYNSAEQRYDQRLLVVSKAIAN
jgi:sortase (surface protein transpeptidase)